MSVGLVLDPAHRDSGVPWLGKNPSRLRVRLMHAREAAKSAKGDGKHERWSQDYLVCKDSGVPTHIVTTHSTLLLDLLPAESLFVCRKVAGETRIEPLRTWGPLARQKEIGASLDDQGESELMVSERILRGDFDA